MAERTTEGLQDLHALLDQLTALIATVDADSVGRPTPCSEWTVGQLVEHVIGTTEKFAGGVAGREVDWSASSTVTGDPAEAFGVAAAALRTAYDDPADDAMPDLQCAELAVHTYDLATGLGVGTADLAQPPAERGLALMQASMKPEMRGDFFGPEQPAPDGADAYQRIAAFAGRSVG